MIYELFVCFLEEIAKGALKMMLFSGCKHENGDYIYREEFREYAENAVLERYYMAFSRDQVGNYKEIL